VSKVRARVEHVFGAQQTSPGGYGAANSGRMQAVYYRPCSAMMIADACLRASISASISLAARK
jgi:hypothetical protein